MEDTISECMIMDQEGPIRDHNLKYNPVLNIDLYKKSQATETVTGNLDALPQHITPMQKMVAACFGALLTSLFSKILTFFHVRLTLEELYSNLSQ